MQREINQRRTDYLRLMDIKAEKEKFDVLKLKFKPNNVQLTKAIDDFFDFYRNISEKIDNRWQNVRLRVLTLRSRLESNSLINRNTQTVCPVTTVRSNCNSLYSVPSAITGIAAAGPSRFGSFTGINDIYSIAGTGAYSLKNAPPYGFVAAERATRLVLSLRELTEWIIKRQTEIEQKHHIIKNVEIHQQTMNRPQNIMSMETDMIFRQKCSFIQLRNQLVEKRPIIDSSLLACHDFLRRLAMKRAAQETKKSGKGISASASMNLGMSTNDQQDQDLEKVEQSLIHEMNKLLELWYKIQQKVDIGIQNLDEAHQVGVTI